jgi:hypothetical protein
MEVTVGAGVLLPELPVPEPPAPELPLPELEEEPPEQPAISTDTQRLRKNVTRRICSIVGNIVMEKRGRNKKI